MTQGQWEVAYYLYMGVMLGWFCYIWFQHRRAWREARAARIAERMGATRTMWESQGPT